MARLITFYKSYFHEFYEEQISTVALKIDFILDFIQLIDEIPERFLKPVDGTQGLYEIQILIRRNIYRIFSFFDEGTLIVMGNSTHNKKVPTPENEIEEALKLKASYFNQNEHSMKPNPLKTFEEHLVRYHEQKGTLKRQTFDNQSFAFRLGEKIRVQRAAMDMAQQDLALKAGIHTNEVARIERGDSEIKLSTLLKIIEVGLGKQLDFMIV